MNTGVQIGVQVSAFNPFGYTPQNGPIGSYGRSIFKLLRNDYTVFHSSAPLYIPTSNARGFQSLHILTKYLLFSNFCDNSHPGRWEVVSHYGNLFLTNKHKQFNEEKTAFLTNGARTGDPYAKKNTTTLIQTHTLYKQ